jgi:hypothetical protein
VEGVVRLSQLLTAVDTLEAAEDIIARLRYPILVRRRLGFDLWRFRIRKYAADAIRQLKGLETGEWARRG